MSGSSTAALKGPTDMMKPSFYSVSRKNARRKYCGSILDEVLNADIAEEKQTLRQSKQAWKTIIEE